jgi:hypothetical protein
MLDRDKLIALHLEALTELDWTPPGDVIDQIIAGGLLTTTMAADVCEVTKTTVHRWMEGAAAKGRPLGVLTPAGYLIGLERLLDYVETEQDRHERNKAKARAAKYSGVWSQPLSLKKAQENAA